MAYLHRTKLLFIVVLSILCMCQGSDLQYSIDEESPPRVFIGNVPKDAKLADKYEPSILEDLRYSFLQGQSQNQDELTFLSIEEDNGDIRTSDWIDRETLCQQRQECSIKVDVAVTPSEYFEIISVEVVIRDINDQAPRFPTSQITREISELAAPSARISLPVATDQDSPLFGISDYQLSRPNAKFDLDVEDLGSGVKSVQLVLKEELDRETVGFYQVTLLALDKGSPPKTGSVLVNITVVDGNDHRPYFENTTYSVNVPENYPVNRSIIRVQAHDADIGSNGKISYSFAPGTETQIFGIDGQTGQIYLKGALDYEVQESYNLVIAAQDGGVNSQPALTTVIVNIQDLNDCWPQIAVNTLTASGNAQISEDSKVGTFVAHVSVVDNDAGINGEFSCTLDNNKFRLEKLQETQHKIVTADVFDREIQASFSVMVTCQDFGDPPNLSTESITVTVLDENDWAPEYIPKADKYLAEIRENNHVNAFVIKINATDRDEGDNSDITFKLQGSQAEYFTIHPKLGTVRAAYVFDYEAVQRFDLQVVASDNGVPPKSSVVSLEVLILDANDESPQFAEPIYEFEVVENQPIGMEIGIVQATDADSEPFNKIEYSIEAGKASQAFAIDTDSGHIRTKIRLDREESKTYRMTILATNNASPPLSGSTEVIITVLDENDNPPVIDFPSKHNRSIVISNLVPAGYKVGYIRAHDLDDGKNQKLMFSIAGGNEGNSFVMDSQSGLISTNAKFDKIPRKEFDLLISVGDHGFPQKLAVATLNITIDKNVPLPLDVVSDEDDSLIGSSNLTIVLGVAIASAIIVIILVVAIVFTKLQIQRRREQGQSKWRLQALKLWRQDGGANKESSTDDVDLDTVAAGGVAGGEIPIVTTDHTLQQQQHQIPQSNGKSVSFNLRKTSPSAGHENQAYTADTAPTSSDKSNNKVCKSSIDMTLVTVSSGMLEVLLNCVLGAPF